VFKTGGRGGHAARRSRTPRSKPMPRGVSEGDGEGVQCNWATRPERCDHSARRVTRHNIR
jgi:hypothetical protein